jgi:metallo-beta-lactamase class B
MRFTVALSVLAILLTGATQAQQPQPAPKDIPVEFGDWLEPTDPLHIAGPIHYVGTRGIGVYLITTPAGHILLDGGMPGTAPLVEASIRKLGFKPEDIRLLLVSHAHFDHVGSLAALKKLTGASIEAMAGDDELLKSGGKTDYVFADNPRLHFEPVTVDRVLKDGDVVTLGGITLTARHTAGHTRGNTTWMTTIEESGSSYKVVFAGSATVNPGTRLVRNPSYPGILEDYRHSLDLLETLKPDIFLAGHGVFFDFEGKRGRAAQEGVKAWIDPEGYRRRVAIQREAFEALVAKENGAAAAK